MRTNFFRITVIKTTPPRNTTINEELQWLGGSLGLFNLRDKDKSCFRIFIELLKSARLGQSISSDELAAHLLLSRGTVVHHLNKLMESGIVIHQANHYRLRTESMSELIDEIEKEMLKMCEEMRKVAVAIDGKLS